MNEPAAAIAADARPRLPRGVRLTHNEAQGGWVLLAPERVFKADAIARRDPQALHRRGDVRARSSTIWPRPSMRRASASADVTALLRGLPTRGCWNLHCGLVPGAHR